jgi:hypothetical protein
VMLGSANFGCEKRLYSIYLPTLPLTPRCFMAPGAAPVSAGHQGAVDTADEVLER